MCKWKQLSHMVWGETLLTMKQVYCFRTSQQRFPTVKSASQTLLGASVFSLWQQGTRPVLLLTRSSKSSLGRMKKYQRRPLAAAFSPQRRLLLESILILKMQTYCSGSLFALRTCCPTERGGGGAEQWWWLVGGSQKADSQYK